MLACTAARKYGLYIFDMYTAKQEIHPKIDFISFCS